MIKFTSFFPLTFLSLLLLSLAIADAKAAPAASTIFYSASTANFANPERGLYHAWATSTKASAPLDFDQSTLESHRIDEKITMMYCKVLLDSFVTAPISQSFLDHIQSNFDTIRAAGLKCILRFAYTDDDSGPPYGDATKAQILAHIDQLRPILQANADVIATMHRGFIGVWGEGYYTQHFVDDPSLPYVISEAQWQHRRDVLEAVLGTLPPSRMVAVRYAEAKQNMLETTTALILAEAFDGSVRARTSFHNDCFLASDTDYGTWQSAAGKSYMADDSQFLAYGGETCKVNLSRSECPTALVEMALFHWSYLNIEYEENVLADWQTKGCLDVFRQKLGYRFVLQEGTYADSVRPGHQFDVNITLDNVGYASPFNPRPVQLLLRHQGTGDIYAAALPEDPRFWFGGQTAVLDHNICLPNNIPSGSYDLLLSLPDHAPTLRTRPEYAILLANTGGVQETATGYNDLLHTLVVTAAAPATACTDGIAAAPLTAVPTAPTLTASRSGSQVALGWNVAEANCTVTLYDDTIPYFMVRPEAIYDDMLTAGTTAYTVALAEAAPHFYAVEVVGCDGGETAVSSQVGSFPFVIQPGG